MNTVQLLGRFANFYSHTPRGVRQVPHASRALNARISTHTPLAGCDFLLKQFINIIYPFLLTHPSRGATPRSPPAVPFHKFLLTHPSRGATLANYGCKLWCAISTHTPLAGCDASNRVEINSLDAFLLTHPSRGATNQERRLTHLIPISTHTPLAGCDQNAL